MTRRPPTSHLRAVRAALWRPGVVGLVVGAVLWGLGMVASSAAVVAVAAATVAAVLQRVDGQAEPRPAPRARTSRDGARGEVLDLAWHLVGRDGHAGERAVRRLRETATRRLARHGVDLADPEHAGAVAHLLGARAAATLARRSHPLPTVRDLVHTLDALDALGSVRAAPPGTTAPEGTPAPPGTLVPPDAPALPDAPDPRSTR